MMQRESKVRVQRQNKQKNNYSSFMTFVIFFTVLVICNYRLKMLKNEDQFKSINQSIGLHGDGHAHHSALCWTGWLTTAGPLPYSGIDFAGRCF